MLQEKKFHFLAFCLVCMFSTVFFSCSTILAEEELPEEVSLVPLFDKLGLTPVDNGTRDTSGPFAITALVEYDYNMAFTGQRKRFSPEFLVWAANESTTHTGDQAYCFECIHALNKLGICEEALMPYEEKPDAERKPSPAALLSAQMLIRCWEPHYIRRNNTKEPMTVEQWQEIRKVLADGRPVACAFRWPRQAVRSTLLRVPKRKEIYTSHSVVLVGYSEKGKRKGHGKFIYRDCNGTGRNAYGEMSYSYARVCICDAMWLKMCVPIPETAITRIEAEHMKVKTTHDFKIKRSDSMWHSGAPMWSNGRHLYARSEKKGSFFELTFNVPKAGKYRMRLYATASFDFATVQIALDGTVVADNLDLYCEKFACPTGPIELGEYNYIAGDHTLRVTALEIKPYAPQKSYYVGLDYIELISK